METDKSLADLANRFELLVQSVTDYAIYMLDPSGTVASWNAGAERFKGYRPSEIIGSHFSRFYTDEDKAANLPAIALRTAERDGRFEAEGWRLRSDGSRFWANVVIDPIRGPDGALLGYAKITRDLTERRLADDQLRRSEERFRLLVQSVTDYAIYMLDMAGNVSSWNPGAARFKGYAEEEIIGEHFSRFYLPEDQATDLPNRALATALREGRFEAEGWRVRKDGTRFWASVVIDPIRADNGDLVGFAKITRDLTERRETQLALETAQRAFLQSQKMEAIGKLTGGVAHDFNNLLAAIIGSLELVKRRGADGKDVTRFIDNAMQAAQRGATLTQRMLAFARKQEMELVAVDLHALVRGMADLLERTISSDGIMIETQFPLVLKAVTADPAQLELAVMNLVVNARDAMPKGGRIVISARRGEACAEPGLAPGEYIRLSITDDGQGMDETTLAQAIDPFFTTKGIGKGTGLGLSMVAGMAEQFGGKLSIKSALGAGTTVTMWLPIAGDFAKQATDASARATVRDITPMNVLAVDDDETVLLNTAAMLSDVGLTVFQAASGAEALEVLKRHRIDVLVTDYAMPGMTGEQLADAVQAGWPEISILIISGYAELPAGFASRFPRLAKPFREEDLTWALADLLHRSDTAEVVPFRTRLP